MMTSSVTQDIVREFLNYDPDTGALLWRERDVKWFCATNNRSAKRTCTQWNSYRAGKPAGSIRVNGYLKVKIFGTDYLAHRIIWLYMTGEWPPEFIDHKNGARADNRWGNLRSVTGFENQKNMTLRSNSASGAIGVSWNHRSKKWYSRIGANGKSKHLGSFDSVGDARAAYITAARKLGYTDRHIYGDTQ